MTNMKEIGSKNEKIEPLWPILPYFSFHLKRRTEQRDKLQFVSLPPCSAAIANQSIKASLTADRIIIITSSLIRSRHDGHWEIFISGVCPCHFSDDGHSGGREEGQGDANAIHGPV